MSWLSRLLGRGRAARKIKPGEQYVSSFADFRCGPFPLDTVAEDAFGPHGGTVQLKDEVDAIRIDVEQFAPPLQGADLARERDALYEGYLKTCTLPLVQQGVPTATLMAARLTTIKGHAVMQSAILMPGCGGAVTPEGKRVDGVRAQVQYTNGRFMYTVSQITIAWPQQPAEERVKNAYLTAQHAFELCHFSV